MVAREDPETRRAVDARRSPCPTACRWCGRCARSAIAEASRVYGPDLMARYCARSAATGTTMFLYGGRSDEALAQLTQALRAPLPRACGSSAAGRRRSGR